MQVEKRLENILYKIIKSNEYIEFLIGRDGDFDLWASSVIRRAIKNYSNKNTCFVLVLPYMRAEYKNNESSFLEYYDEIEICSQSSRVHYKAAIGARNRSMVDRSNLVICYVDHKQGGAYKAVEYAKKKEL